METIGAIPSPLSANAVYRLPARIALKIFVYSFLCACLLQGARWMGFGSLDDYNWSEEARFVQENDPRQFDQSMMYGYPARPVIDGTRGLHLLGLPYNFALIVFLTLGDALVIACITLVIQWLRRDVFWTVSAFGLLAVNPLYVHASAPSAVATLLLVLLCLLTLAIDERRTHPRLGLYLAWSIVLGIAVAVRADIGVFTGAFFAVVVLLASNAKTVLAMLGGAFVTFMAFDPYMWFMPVRHVGDLVHKIIFHYAEIAPAAITAGQVWKVSFLLAVSLGIGGVALFRRGRIGPLPVSVRFFLSLVLFTACSYGIFLTARFQTERYYLPIVFIWQALLPLFLLALAPVIPFSFLPAPAAREHARAIYRRAIPGLLVGGNLAYFAFALIAEHVFPIH